MKLRGGGIEGGCVQEPKSNNPKQIGTREVKKRGRVQWIEMSVRLTKQQKAGVASGGEENGEKCKDEG